MRDPRLTITQDLRVNIFRHLFIHPYTHPHPGGGGQTEKLVSNVGNLIKKFGSIFLMILDLEVGGRVSRICFYSDLV